MHTFSNTRRPLAPNASAHPLDVVTIKSALGALGHYEAPEWGISQFPDGELFRAIKAFQKAQGLKTDGVIKPDGETLAALQDTLKGAKGRTATQTIARALQDLGRNGDTLLAHLTPAEAQLLHDVTDGGSINPETGLLEFWGRLGGSKASRARREKAENRTASAERSASSSQQSGDWDSDSNRTLGYNDFNPGGMHGDKNRNGTKKTGAALGAHNRAVAAQQAAAEKAANEQRIQTQLHAEAQRAKAQKAAEAQRQHEQDLSDAAARAQKYGAMTANEKENTLSRMLSTKPTKAPATGFSLPDAAAAAATPPTTNAPAQSTQAARASTATPHTPQGKDISPSWGPSATPAQQFRNIKKAEKIKAKAVKDAAKAELAAEKQLTTTATLSFSSAPQVHAMTAPKTRTYTPKQLAAAAQANKTAAIGRQRVNDYLGIMRERKEAGKTLTADGRKAAWGSAKQSHPSGASITTTQPNHLSQSLPISGIIDPPSKVAKPVSFGLDLLSGGFQVASEMARMFGLDQTSKNLDHFLNGNGKTVTLSKDEARQSPAVRDGEETNQGRIANNTFTGNTGNIGLNSTMRNLQNGGTVTLNDNWTAASDDKDTARNAITNFGSGGVDAALAFGRQTVASDVTFTATRKNDTIHVQGTVTHNAIDKYDFHEDRTGDYVGATNLQNTGRGTPFETKSTWRQSVTGTVDVLDRDNNGNVLGKPNLSWKDIN